MGRKVVLTSRAHLETTRDPRQGGEPFIFVVFKVVKEEKDVLWVRSSVELGKVRRDAVVPLESALAYFNDEVARRPQEHFGYLMRSVVLTSHLKRHDLALADCRRAIELLPQSPIPHLRLAMVLADKRDFRGAELACNDAIAADPSCYEAFIVRGFYRSDPAARRLDYEAAVRIGPERAPGYRWLGQALTDHTEGVQEARLREAQRCLDRSVALDPGDPDSFALRAMVFIRLRENERAKADLETAGKIDQNCRNAIFADSFYCEAIGDADGAIAAMDRAIRLYPDYGPYYLRRSECWRGKRMIERSMEDLVVAVRLEPAFFLAQYDLGRHLLLVGRGDEAIDCLTRAIELNPESQMARASRCEAYCEVADLESARKDLAAAARLNPNDCEVLNCSACVKLLEGNIDGAIDGFGKANECAQSRGEFYWNRAKAKLLKKDLAGAIEDLNRAHELGPWLLALLRDRALVHLVPGDLDSLGDAQCIIETDRWKRGISIVAGVIGHFAERRLGLEPRRKSFLQEAIENADKALWEYRLLSYLSGALSAKDLLAANLDRRQREIAGYTVGMKELLDGNLDKAREQFRAIESEGTWASVIRSSVILELDRLNENKP